MKDSHAPLNISEKDWQARVSDFKATLAKLKVPMAEQKELLKIVGSTHDELVTKPERGKGRQ